MQLHPHACSRPIEGLGRPELTAPFPRPASFAGASVYSAVQQQDYSSGVWLRRRDKLEHRLCVVLLSLEFSRRANRRGGFRRGKRIDSLP
ncbi:hypothetical protein ANANG_G00049880 [Anguilla anguilla]|uniref:Uncharacterized protein n=1 Tax=Anguilla anguilla TaxID=7936 RepID=A0A9D3MYS7_ANGAN|nr:hypothetical protein ANANG_G00049880 [Anguilla anguilla]